MFPISLLDRYKIDSVSLRNNHEMLLLLMAVAMSFSFAGWMALLNNFVIERASFGGKEIGILQSLREIPGLLAFSALLWIGFIREQRFALLNLALLGGGVFITGWFPSILGLYVTTVIMSVGFHYFETIHTSLTLQWIPKDKTPLVMGRQLGAKSVGAIFSFITIFMMASILDYRWIYMILGGFTLIIAMIAWQFWPQFPSKIEQKKTLVLRSRYSLFYILTFMSGARRQIFVVFAAFMMVEKFHFSVSAIAAMFLLNHAINTKLAPFCGRLITRWGERRALCIEYVGLFLVFTGYAFVESPIIAVCLYIFDHMFFSLGIAIKSYFQKIADPDDIASSAAVSFSINHIAAVFLPAVLGLLWLVLPSYVFLLGSAMALISLLLSLCIPDKPAPGNEMTLPIKIPILSKSAPRG